MRLLIATKPFVLVCCFSLILLAFVKYSSGEAYLDDTSGLIWQYCSAGMNRVPWGCQNEPLLLTWQQALKYCAQLKQSKSNDWRLPSRNELLSLVDWKRRVPSTVTELIDSTKNNVYWSSTSFPDDPRKAYYTSMFSGYSYANFKTVHGYVRCVKTLG